MSERVDQGTLPLPIRHVVASIISIGARRSGGPEHTSDILDAKHDLTGHAGNPLVVSKLAHYDLGALAVYPELHPVRLTDADMLDQPENPHVPRDGLTHVCHREDRDHPRPGRGSVRLHADSVRGTAVPLPLLPTTTVA